MHYMKPLVYDNNDDDGDEDDGGRKTRHAADCKEAVLLLLVAPVAALFVMRWKQARRTIMHKVYVVRSAEVLLFRAICKSCRSHEELT